MGDWGWTWTSPSDKRAILDGIADGECYGGPFHAELQLTDRCNLDCGFCCTRNIRRGAELPLHQIVRLTAELKTLGCHSITLNGGGEPLFHRQIDQALQAIADAGLWISNLTTNGTRLSPRIADLLRQARCRQVIVSLNAGNAEQYRRMMGASPRNFALVVENIRGLVAARREASPRVVVQFLVCPENVSSIAGMYRTAVELGVDRVLFNDIVGPGWRMEAGAPDFARQMDAFHQVMDEDRDRGMAVIHSHNFDMAVHLTARRCRRPAVRDFLGKLRAPVTRKGRAELRQSTDCCIAPWHSMTVRATGEVPVCCAMQDRIVDQSGERSIREIWHGPAFGRIRQQIRRSIAEGDDWRYRPERDTEIVDLCAGNCGNDRRCRFRSYYFANDWAFVRRLREVIAAIRRVQPPTANAQRATT